MENIFQDAARLIKNAKNILLVPHAKMDCDAMSSAIALYQILQKMGKNATAVCTDPVPEAFSFLPSTNIFAENFTEKKDDSFLVTLDASQKGFRDLRYEVKDGKVNILIFAENGNFEETDFSFSPKNLPVDLIITLDSGDIQQLGKIYNDNTELFSRVPVVNIDHHVSNSNFGTVNLVVMKNSSTTEIVYDLLPYLDASGHEMITEDMATLLLAGMITDTGSFQHSNTTPKALDIAGNLIEKGARQQEIIKNIFKKKQLSTLRLWGRVLTKLQNDAVYRMVWSTVSALDFQETQSHSDETEGLIDELLATTPGTELVMLMREREDGVIATSVRTSSNLVNAIDFTKKFGGGGHRQAAGFKIRERGGKSFEEIVGDIVLEGKKFQAERLKMLPPIENISHISQDISGVSSISAFSAPIFPEFTENVMPEFSSNSLQNAEIFENIENSENLKNVENHEILVPENISDELMVMEKMPEELMIIEPKEEELMILEEHEHELSVAEDHLFDAFMAEKIEEEIEEEKAEGILEGIEEKYEEKYEEKNFSDFSDISDLSNISDIVVETSENSVVSGEVLVDEIFEKNETIADDTIVFSKEKMEEFEESQEFQSFQGVEENEEHEKFEKFEELKKSEENILANTPENTPEISTISKEYSVMDENIFDFLKPKTEKLPVLEENSARIIHDLPDLMSRKMEESAEMHLENAVENENAVRDLSFLEEEKIPNDGFSVRNLAERLEGKSDEIPLPEEKEEIIFSAGENENHNEEYQRDEFAEFLSQAKEKAKQFEVKEPENLPKWDALSMENGENTEHFENSENNEDAEFPLSLPKEEISEKSEALVEQKEEALPKGFNPFFPESPVENFSAPAAPSINQDLVQKENPAFFPPAEPFAQPPMQANYYFPPIEIDHPVFAPEFPPQPQNFPPYPASQPYQNAFVPQFLQNIPPQSPNFPPQSV